MSMDQLDLSQLLDGDRFILGLSGRNVIATKIRISGDKALIEFAGNIHITESVRLSVGDALVTPTGEWLGRITFLSQDLRARNRNQGDQHHGMPDDSSYR